MKKLLALLLAICLCLTFAACGEDKEEEISKGEKMYKKYKEIISYMEDGNYDAAYDAMVALSGDSLSGENNGSEFSAYEDIFEALTREDFSAAIEAIIRLENSKNQKEPTDFMKLLCNDWYGAKFADQQLPQQTSVSFNADGKCNILGQEYTWTVDNEWDNGMRLKIYSGSTQMFSAEIYQADNEIAYLNIWDSQNNGISVGRFYLNPMMIYATRYWYRLDDTVESLPESLDVGYEQMNINGNYYALKEVSQQGSNELILEGFTKNATTASYRLRVFMRDDIYVAEVTDVATGVATIYYNSGNGGYSKEWVEYRYNYAQNALQSLLKGYSIDFEGQHYSGRDAWGIIYKMFDGCRGYSDADTILSDFTILTKMYTGFKFHYIDNLNNTDSSTIESLSYDSTGRITSADSYDLEMFLFGSYRYNTNVFYFDYDEGGRISQILYGYSRNDVRAIFIPTYDEAGNIVAMEKRTNDAIVYNYYSYDAEGRLIRAEFNRDTDGVMDCYYDLSYNASGRLEAMTGKIYHSSVYEFEVLYTYDNQGHLLNKTTNIYKSRTYSYYEDWYESFDFTCDADGDPISAVVTGSEYTGYASVTMEIVYKDLYFYEP